MQRCGTKRCSGIPQFRPVLCAYRGAVLGTVHGKPELALDERVIFVGDVDDLRPGAGASTELGPCDEVRDTLNPGRHDTMPAAVGNRTDQSQLRVGPAFNKVAVVENIDPPSV